MPTVRTDFFLDPADRLTELERSLMTAMLVDLVGSIADEIRAGAGLRAGPANDESTLFERLWAAGLLDIPELIALLLCRAEQERAAAAVRPHRGGSAGLLHLLAASGDPDTAAAAMGLILGQSRRRDRFDAPRADLNDVPAGAAVQLANAIAAALREEAGDPETADRRLADGAAALLARHDEGKRMEALCFALVHALDRAGGLDDETVRAMLTDGELALFAEAVARRAGIDAATAWNGLAAGSRDLALLLRMAAIPRHIAAEMAVALAASGEYDAAELIGQFDRVSDQEVERERGWLRLDRHYRAAAGVMGDDHGDQAV